MRIRPFRPEDRPALAEVCVRTGADGSDATGLLRDPRLLTTVYLDPYLELAPALATVLTIDDAVVGYVLGVADTVNFEAACARSWWPAARKRHPADPTAPPRDAELLRRIHGPGTTPPEVTGPFPAHLHVDLVPAAQGRGGGRLLLEHLFAQLRERGAAGIHLGVSAANPGARAFYERLGFAVLEADDGGALMARTL